MFDRALIHVWYACGAAVAAVNVYILVDAGFNYLTTALTLCTLCLLIVMRIQGKAWQLSSRRARHCMLRLPKGYCTQTTYEQKVLARKRDIARRWLHWRKGNFYYAPDE
jgi:hypothetical protein